MTEAGVNVAEMGKVGSRGSQFEMKSNYKLVLMFNLQKILLTCSYWFFRLTQRKKNRCIDWVVGVDETAGIISYVSKSLKRSYSVSLSLSSHPFYEFNYDFSCSTHRILKGPILLGKLLNQASGFFYIWSTGFLISVIDNREFEFNFIRRKNKKIVCCFCGSDIRAPRLMIQLEKKNGLENISTYLSQISKSFLTDWHDQNVKNTALISEKYAHLIFNASVDQMAYFSKPTKPFIYLYPTEKIKKNKIKYYNMDLIKIVHAPSSPIIKGTQLVRAAIKKLKEDGYVFQYQELINVSNKRVLRELRDAHIVLNQFYAFMPGFFGIEAMASHCALLTSADETIETGLPKGSNKAWIVTRYYQIYENLKQILDNTSLIEPQADVGFDWVLEHASSDSSGKKLATLLEEIE